MSENTPTNSIQVINLMNDLFPPPPYRCQSRRMNADMSELLRPTYRENFEELKSTRTGKPLGIYQRDIGEYDMPEIITLTFEEWQVYGNRPQEKIDALDNEIREAHKREGEAGIVHYDYFTDWYSPDMFQKIEVPDLVADYPFEKNEFVDDGKKG